MPGDNHPLVMPPGVVRHKHDDVAWVGMPGDNRRD
jgi:hypothetical protein